MALAPICACNIETSPIRPEYSHIFSKQNQSKHHLLCAIISGTSTQICVLDANSPRTCIRAHIRNPLYSRYCHHFLLSPPQHIQGVSRWATMVFGFRRFRSHFLRVALFRGFLFHIDYQQQNCRTRLYMWLRVYNHVTLLEDCLRSIRQCELVVVCCFRCGWMHRI